MKISNAYDAFLKLARAEAYCSISAGTKRGESGQTVRKHYVNIEMDEERQKEQRMNTSVAIPGSYREHPRGSQFVKAADAQKILTISLILRPLEKPGEEKPLSHCELVEVFGARLGDIEAVETFAHEHGFSIVRIHPASRVVEISGRLGDMAAIFDAAVEMRCHDGRVLMTRQGDLKLPESLSGRIIAVLGFDERPAARSHCRHSSAAGPSLSYTPPQVAQLYSFPQGTGTGQTIALIELGGGYKSSDLKAYWSKIGVPAVFATAVSIDGAFNDPQGDPSSADSEVLLDMEVAGGVAPGAKLAVYFAPNTDQGFLDAINAAIHDTVRKPSVISISWGGPEKEWTGQAMNAYNATFHDAALLGITVCCASGDDGSTDGETDGINHVDFPASSPWVLACGGTTLLSRNGNVQSETVWNNLPQGGSTGGGVSSHFSQPSYYQSGINVPPPPAGTTINTTGRGVPDVAGVADPQTGFMVHVDGQDIIVGGTSAVAPLWAGLIAVLNEQLGKNIGWPHRKLYLHLAQSGALNDITSGDNGSYPAGTGWDCCTGLGSPNGQALLDALKKL